MNMKTRAMTHAIMLCNLCILLTLFITPCKCADPSNFIEVKTTDGTIRGHRVQTGPLEYLEVFTGVPYAQAPVGQLRFAPPQPVKPWGKEVKNTTSFGAACPQDPSLLDLVNYPHVPMSEDCLFLNVYSPKLPRKPEEGSTYPVMVWFHGGWFTIGTSSYFDARILASHKGVIVVTVNYRLGLLGFFSTSDDAAPGNYGLLDQTESLRWVQRNIAQFGGDPKRVTIFGESAGGRSVGLHLMSPLSKGLFQGAIPMSGLGISPWTVHTDPAFVSEQAMNVANAVHCPLASTAHIVKCLRRKDVNELAGYHVRNGFRWAATIDDYFLTDLPEQIIDKYEFNRVPILTGNVRNEGSVKFLEEEYMTPEGFNKTFTEEVFRRFLLPLYGAKTKDVLKATLCEYMPSDDARENRDLYMELVSDVTYISPQHRYAAMNSQVVSSTWLYFFDYRSINDPSPLYYSVHHASEVSFVFGAPFWSQSCPWGCDTKWRNSSDYWTKQDEEMSDVMMTIWSNFAKYGDPNPLPTKNIYWPEYNEYMQDYLHIKEPLDVSTELKDNRMSFWNSFIPDVLLGEDDASERCNRDPYKDEDNKSPKDEL